MCVPPCHATSEYKGGGLWCLTPLEQQYCCYIWRSVLLVEETTVPGENNKPFANQLYIAHNVVLGTPGLAMRGIRTLNFSGDSCKSNFHTIPTTTLCLV